MRFCFTDKETYIQKVVIGPCEFMKDLDHFCPHFPQWFLAVLRTLTHIFYHLKDLLWTKDSQIHISSQEFFGKFQIYIQQVPAKQLYLNVSHILKFNMFKFEFTVFSSNLLFSLWSVTLLRSETWNLIPFFFCWYPTNHHFL